MPFEVIPYIRSLCKIDGMYGDDINGTTPTVGFEAITVLKQDGTALIPAPLVPELKGISPLPIKECIHLKMYSAQSGLRFV